jgi:hypothetical protein
MACSVGCFPFLLYVCIWGVTTSSHTKSSSTVVLFSPFSLSLQIRAPLRSATTSSGYDSYHSPHRRCYMLHTLRRAAVINENLRIQNAPPHAATIHFINQQQSHHHKEQETPDSLLQEQKRHYCRHHYRYSHHHPTTVSSPRATNSTRATTLADSNRYLWALTWDIIRFSLSKKLKDGTQDSPQFNNTFQKNQGYADPWGSWSKLKMFTIS